MAKTTEMVEVTTTSLIPYERNAKKHPQDQLEKLKKSIQEFGFISPCLIDRDLRIIAGHGRVEAAKQLGMETVPCVFIEGLTDEQRRAYIIADNRLTELGGWDEEIIRDELLQLNENGFDVSLTGFDLDEFVDNIEGFEEKDDALEALPESRLCVCTISAFGTQSDAVIIIKIQQEQADRILQVIQEEGTEIVRERMEGVINAI